MTDQGPATSRTELDVDGDRWEITWELQPPWCIFAFWRGCVHYRLLPGPTHPGTFGMEGPMLTGISRRHLERRLRNWELGHVLGRGRRPRLFTDGRDVWPG